MEVTKLRHLLLSFNVLATFTVATLTVDVATLTVDLRHLLAILRHLLVFATLTGDYDIYCQYNSYVIMFSV